MSADNYCLPGSEFHSTIPVAVPASGHSGADQPVVSRQSLPARVRIPFHDTDNAVVSGAEVQNTPLSADNRSQSAARVPFHDTYSGSALGHSGADHLVVSRQSMFARVIIPFHATCSSTGQRVLWCRSARCQSTIDVYQGRNSISRYL